MDWLPHVVIKAEHDACAKTATTALRTLHVGFPDQTATVSLTPHTTINMLPIESIDLLVVMLF